MYTDHMPAWRLAGRHQTIVPTAIQPAPDRDGFLVYYAGANRGADSARPALGPLFISTRPGVAVIGHEELRCGRAIGVEVVGDVIVAIGA